VIDATTPAIVDLAPTVLKLFGIEVPGYMDGKPIFGAALRVAAKKEANAWKAEVAS